MKLWILGGLWNQYFGRWWNQAGFLWKLVDTDYAGARMMPRDPSGQYQPKLSRIISPLGQSNLETDIFFVFDKADGYFVNYPLEWGFEVFVEEDIQKQGVGRLDNYIYGQNFDNLIVYAENSPTQICNCFELGNVVGGMNKSLGDLGKNTRDIL